MGRRFAALFVFAVACAAPATVLAADGAPLVGPGAPIPVEATAASLFRPVEVHAAFRVPRTDTALYVGTPWYVRDLTVTVVGPGARRDVVTGTAELPGRTLGVRLPADASQADRIELVATTVSAAAPPYLLGADQLAEIAWRNWWFVALFGLFAGLALVHAILAPLLRSRAAGWYAAFTAAVAGLLVPWLGVVRPPPEVSQPVHALLQSAVFVCTLLFTFALFRALRIPSRARIAAWALVAIDVLAVAGGDVLQDFWSVPDLVGQALLLALNLAFVAFGVAAVRANVTGSRAYLAGTALAALGVLVAWIAPADNPVLRAAQLLAGAGEALLFAFALALQARYDARRRAPLPLEHRDGLTGIANRPALDDALAAAWSRAQRAHSPLAALAIDVDRFRAYNEAYGHLAGDDVLRRIAVVMAEAASRRDDVAARSGDDTFALLLPDTDLAGARYIADAILERIAILAIAHPAPPLHRVTASIGVASLTPQHGTGGANDLLRRAESVLYVAKTMGRNRVVADEPVLASPA